MLSFNYYVRSKLLLTSACFGAVLVSLGLTIFSPYHSSMVYAANPDTAASIIIDGGVIKNTIPTESGEVAYNSYKIAVKASDIDSYSLQISAANGSTSKLIPENGTTQMTGANGKVGSSLANNTWGYGWSDTGTAVDTIKYYTLPTYGTNGTSISNGLLESAKAESVDMVKKLTFAAKFGDNATPGHYTTTVLLSLAVSPKTVTENLSTISTMQEMTVDVCKTSAIGDTNTLTDTRDSSTYTIRKNADNNCWMTQNLRIIGSRTLSTANSNVTSNFSLPASSNAFGTANQTIAYYGNNTDYGGFYSWQAATAGSGTSSVTSGNTSTSICPKGWKLPSSNDYNALISAVGAANLRNSPYNFKFAGFYDDNTPNYTGSWGVYWTSTPYDTYSAYTLYLSGTSASTSTTNGNKAYGLSVRCVASSS